MQNFLYQTLLTDILEYINDELKDSKYYALLANEAPTERAKDILLEFSADEQKHAENFMYTYYLLTGRHYSPLIEEPIIPDYEEALKIRILAETRDYKKYGDQYLKYINDPYLRNLFFTTRTYEAIHAMRIPILMEEEVE